MPRSGLGLGLLLLVVGACSLTLPPAPARSASALTAYPNSTSTSTPTSTALPTHRPTSALTPTLPCETDTASVELTASVTRLKVGETVKISATLTNEGCVALGLPQYRLYVQSDGPEPILAPGLPEPVVHSLAVAPGQSDAVDFELRAVAAGRASLRSSASFEVHLGYPGPAYWGYAASPELRIEAVDP